MGELMGEERLFTRIPNTSNPNLFHASTVIGPWIPRPFLADF